MKIQYLAVIFVIIIMPISIVFSEYVNNQINTLNTEQLYNARLLNATYDTIKAYQLNTVNNSFSDKPTSKVSDIEAAVTTFFNSLVTSFGYDGYKSSVIQEYVPAVVFTMYDGYYIYSPFENVLTGVENNSVSNEYKDNSILHGLKPYVYYDCRYKIGTNTDFVITYTLDNYITIEGIINGDYVFDYGYLLDIRDVTTVGNGYLIYKGITFSASGSKEKMKEYLGDKEFYYVKIDGTKFYFDDKNGNGLADDVDGIFYVDSSGNWVYQVSQKQHNEEIFNLYYKAIMENKSSYLYYKEAYEFTNRVLYTTNGGYGLKDLKPNNSDDYLFEFKDINIFEGAIEESNSNFNEHRSEVIRRVIETNLSAAISGFGKYADSNVEFLMPKISETDWSLIENNICVATFFQGMSIGGKMYNGYAVVPNNLTKEYVDENDIYILKGNGEYTKANDNDIKNGTGIRAYGHDPGELTYKPGVLKINLERRKFIDTSSDDFKYYFPIKSLGSYTGIVGSSTVNSIEYTDMYRYMDTVSDELKKIYYTALGRERYGVYNINNGLKEEDRSYTINIDGNNVNLFNAYYLKNYD